MSANLTENEREIAELTGRVAADQVRINAMRNQLEGQDGKLARLRAELERQAAEIGRLRTALQKIVEAGQGITNVPLEIYAIACAAVDEQ